MIPPADANDDDLDRMIACGFKATEEASRQPITTGRYQVLGEIARGGMGTILKGRDVELGRLVALKVLHDRWHANGSLQARFVEEAQIGGQLQHPGVVPVYELGKSNGRPFIAMKLVEGQTLKALLSQRKDSGDERRRFLGIFEQVCQTVAYAHARKVLHRDLKPTNIMVGAFGEVHVVDWGLAKVMGTSSAVTADESSVWTARTKEQGLGSTPGSVLGTPAYMPPEQARGEIDFLDERGDVFALGAILCEILTGHPLYVAENGPEALEAARNCRVEPAFARLDSCGCDGELVAMTRECLAASPESRPHHAGALAARVSSYLAGVEERAQAERVAAAEARVKTRAARKAQKLTAALSGSIVLAVLLGAGTWWRLENQRVERVARATAAVARAVSEAQRLHGEARAAPVEALEPWTRASQSVTSAESLAAAGDVDPRSRAAVDALAVVIRAGEAEAIARARRIAEDRRMAALVESIPTPEDGQIEVQPDTTRDANRRALAYGEAFRGYGIAVETLDDADAVARIRSSAIGVQLSAALDDWALALRTAETKDTGAWRRLVGIARDADEDPSRRALREALLSPDQGRVIERLDAIYSQTDERSLPAVTFFVLGRLLYNLGAFEDGISVLKRGFELHPADFSLAYAVGLALEMMKPVRTGEAIRYLTAARSLRPSNHDACLRLALALDHTGQSEEAAKILEGACLARPDSAALKLTQSMCLYKMGRLDEALRLCEAALQLRPDYYFGHGLMGQICIALGQHARAESAYREELRHNADGAMAHINLGIALYEMGRRDEGIAELERGRELDPSIAGVHNNLGFTREEQGRTLEALDCYRQAVQLEPGHYAAQFNLGRLLRGQRRYQESLRAFDAAISLGHKESESWAKDVRVEITRLEHRLAAVQRGEWPPPDAVECTRLAKLCLEKGLALEAAQYFRAAFHADPALAKDLDSLNLHDAAQAALRAGVEGWGEQAREWLAAELDLWAARIETGPVVGRAAAREQLKQWFHELELTPARDATAPEKLPEAERQAWKALRVRVGALCKTP